VKLKIDAMVFFLIFFLKTL